MQHTHSAAKEGCPVRWCNTEPQPRIIRRYAPGIAVPSSDCPRQCGTVEIPYPFGIGANCSLSVGFNISCKVQDGVSRPFKGDFEVLDISLTHGTLRVLNYITAYCYNASTTSMKFFGRYDGYVGRPSSLYRLSDVQNKFTVIGCNALAFISDYNGTGYQGLGVATCRNLSDLADGSCSGMGCSQTAIPKRMYYYDTTFLKGVNTSEIWEFNPCSYAVLMEAATFRFNTTYINTNKFNDTYNGRVPMILDWAVRDVKSCDVAKQNNMGTYACLSSNSDCVDSTNDQGYTCNCTNGYEGNPYLQDGCKGVIMGLFGVMVIIMIIVFWGQRIIQTEKLNKVKQEYFRQHGGLILFDRMK
uniref:Wall-associated receptor kinase galacturonan-binding domain-containing protein n=1 Tax=Aegilops tauschii subsp. strangulata TaxID=200361 RepID=A0A453CHR0_AEGTS